jgi:hypothetical protein
MRQLRHAWRATVNGVRLGLLDDAALRALDERYYDASDVYVTADWNERGLFAWEQTAVRELFSPGARLLVVACGGGREVLALLAAGYDAYGCESHPALRAFADDLLSSRGHGGRVEPAPRDEVPDGPPCDGIVIGWGAYSLVAGHPRRVGFLRGAGGGWGGGGGLLLSGFGHEAPGSELALTARLANGLRRVRGRERVELGDTLAPNRARILTRADLEHEASAAGFDLLSWHLLGVADGATRYAAAALSAR